MFYNYSTNSDNEEDDVYYLRDIFKLEKKFLNTADKSYVDSVGKMRLFSKIHFYVKNSHNYCDKNLVILLDRIHT